MWQLGQFSKIRSHMWLHGPMKTRYICTNYIHQENGTFLGHCIYYTHSINYIVYLHSKWLWTDILKNGKLKFKNSKFCVQICPIFTGPVTYYIPYNQKYWQALYLAICSKSAIDRILNWQFWVLYPCLQSTCQTFNLVIFTWFTKLPN